MNSAPTGHKTAGQCGCGNLPCTSHTRFSRHHADAPTDYSAAPPQRPTDWDGSSWSHCPRKLHHLHGKLEIIAHQGFKGNRAARPLSKETAVIQRGEIIDLAPHLALRLVLGRVRLTGRGYKPGDGCGKPRSSVRPGCKNVGKGVRPPRTGPALPRRQSRSGIWPRHGKKSFRQAVVEQVQPVAQGKTARDPGRHAVGG